MALLDLVDDAGLQRVQRRALVAAAIGGAASLVGAVIARQQFLRSYLVAYVFFTSLALGALALLMIHHVTGGRWGVVIRRLLESAALTLPVLAGLFVPIALGVRELYVWAQPALVADDPLLQEKALYLNVPFFLVRTAGYFVAWILVARFLARWSLAQDVTDDPALASAVGRRTAHDRIDAELSRWCAAQDRDALVEVLLAREIPAAPVLPARDAAQNPQMRARGFFEAVTHPVTGTHELPGLPMRFSAHGPRWYRRPAPTLGQHSDEVLRELLGLGAAELDQLRAAGVIGERPAGV